VRNDVGLTHLALAAHDVAASIAFYARYARMSVVHERVDAKTGVRVVWLSDRTRPFVVVLIESPNPEPILRPFAHLGVGCATREEVDALCESARVDGVLVGGPEDAGPPVGYWAFLRDPDGHTLELSYGQEIGLAVADAPT
jgi:catechol 2,3-dioxygenase-like lactoylglutathione lyase family enzyme